MKIILLETKKLFEIIDVAQRNYMEFLITSLQEFQKNFSYVRNIDIARKSTIFYINSFFKAADYLYQYYEFSQRYFELLDLAAINLALLSQEKIAALSTDTEKEAARSELGDYLDKVTLIFQTAVDKAGDEDCVRFCTDKARKYSAGADAAHGLAVTPVYAKKILALYGKAEEEYKDDFFGEIFRNRAAEYREKCEAKETPEARTASFSLSGETGMAEEVSDTTPLLGSHRESADGLRRRTVHLDEERPTSS